MSEKASEVGKIAAKTAKEPSSSEGPIRQADGHAPEESAEVFKVGNKLKVSVLKAEGLLAADPWGTSDPYCSVSLGPQRLTTNTVLRTLNPVWSQHLVFPIRGPTSKQLTFSLWDSDVHNDNDPLGQSTLDISSLQLGVPMSATLPVVLKFTHGKPETKGQLWVSVVMEARAPPKAQNAHDESQPLETDPGNELADGHDDVDHEGADGSPSPKRPKTTEPFSVGNKLKVTVIKAAGLLAADPWGTSDPYCSVSFGPQRLVTNTVLKTLDPVWNQQLVFPIRNVAHKQLTFALWDSDLGNDNDPLGQCTFDISGLQVGIPQAATLPVVLKFTHGKAETKGQLWVSAVIEAR